MYDVLHSGRDVKPSPASGARVGAPISPPGRQKPILILADSFKLPYRVLRCAAEFAPLVYVFGTSRALGLRTSRYCAAFFPAKAPIDGASHPDLAVEINEIVARYGVGLIIPGDAPSTRSLITVRDFIDGDCFPSPDLERFDVLNDKWTFKQLCDSLSVPTPRSTLCLTRDEARQAIESEKLCFPLIAKPTNRDGGSGCVKFRGREDVHRLSDVDYAPILIQEFLAGADIGASVFCRSGRIEAFLAQSYVKGTYTAYPDSIVQEYVSRIASFTEASGILHFDIVLKASGEVVFLECNPRVYFKIMMSMLAGMNLLRLGAARRANHHEATLGEPVSVPFPKALLWSLPTPWKWNADAWRVVGFLLADPVPLFREYLGLEG